MARKLDPKPFFAIGIVLVIAAGGYFFFGMGGENVQHREFASCLADSNATMYGFDACPHCNRQKSMIGHEAFRENFSDRGFYVKCRPDSEATKELGERAHMISTVEPLSPDDTQGDACEANVGAGTPTWVIDGEKYVGEQSMEKLAELTGCPLPEEVGQGG